MSRALITESYLTSIANAIRAKNGSSDTYTPPQMAAAIAAIPTGGDVDVEPLSVTANGTYTAPTGKAYSPVAVNVSGGGGGSATILSGTSEPIASIGNDGNIYLRTTNLLQPLVDNQSQLNVIVTANSNWSGFDPWKAFTANSGWIGSGGNPHWIQVEFTRDVTLAEIRFRSLDNSRSHAVSRVGYSANGVDFTDAVLGETTMTGNVGHVVISAPIQSRYYRLYFDGEYGSSSYPMVSTLEMYGGNDAAIIQSTYVKVSGVWQPLIGSYVSDVGGVNV